METEYRCLSCHQFVNAIEERCSNCNSNLCLVPIEWEIHPRLNWEELRLLFAWADRWCLETGDSIDRELIDSLYARLKLLQPDRSTALRSESFTSCRAVLVSRSGELVRPDEEPEDD